MLKHIRIIPLAAESFGVRSMCTYVETPDAEIVLDAGVSLCPNRFGLPPHPKEFKAIAECRRRIAETSGKAEIVTISHYHFDHHTPSYEDWLSQWTEENETAKQIYQDKIVLAKNPKEHINYSQRRRGWVFQKTGGSYAAKFEVADGKAFTFGETQVRFSEPVFHGSDDSFLGWVLMTTVEYRQEKFMFAPDVQGPISERTLEMIIGESPELIMLGGPPTYLMGFKVEEKQIQAGLMNLQQIVEHVPTTIVEHHLLRDEGWKEKATEAFYKAYKSGHTILTAAEFLGQPNNFLESLRKKLFAACPPSKEFADWMKMSVDRRGHVKPPI